MGPTGRCSFRSSSSVDPVIFGRFESEPRYVDARHRLVTLDIADDRHLDRGRGDLARQPGLRLRRRAGLDRRRDRLCPGVRDRVDGRRQEFTGTRPGVLGPFLDLLERRPSTARTRVLDLRIGQQEVRQLEPGLEVLGAARDAQGERVGVAEPPTHVLAREQVADVRARQLARRRARPRERRDLGDTAVLVRLLDRTAREG